MPLKTRIAGGDGRAARRRDVAAEVAAEEGADDRRRQHPRDDRPGDAPLARVPHRAGRGRGGADPDVRAGAGCRARGEQDHQRQPQRAEHEPDRRAEVAGDERAGCPYREPPGFQSGSGAPGVRGPREDEEQVGEPVQVDERERVHRRDAGARRLGTPADRARDVQPRRGLAPAGQDEALQRRAARSLNRSQSRLEPVDLRLLDPELPVALRVRAPRGRRRGRRARSGSARAARAARPARRPRARARAGSSARRPRRRRRRAGRSSGRASRRRGSSRPRRRRACRSASAGRARRASAATHPEASACCCRPRIERAITSRWISLVPS